MATKSPKKRVLFVGSFKRQAKDGSVGGQMFACLTLIDSNLSEKVEWLLIDSTADSNKGNSLINRLFKAIRRLSIFKYHCIFSRVDTCLIFTADGLSFVEKGLMVLIASVLGKKTILSPRSGLVVNDLKNSGFMRWYIPFVLKLCNVVVCQGESWKVFYRKLVTKNKEKFVVVQNWIDGASYFELSRNKEVEPIILFLSWVDRNKGILDLINAVNRLKESHPKLKLHIAGDGKAMDESRELVERLGLGKEVVFHGWATGEKKLELLSTANIYVLPSYFEGFPNSLMEAMAGGLAVISTKVGSIPDLVSHDKNGLLFEAGNVDELHSCLSDLSINIDKRWDLSEKARERIKRNNTTEIAINKFTRILEV